MISRRAFTAALGASMASCLCGCMTHETGPVTGLPDLPPGYRPDMKTDEAGMWLQAEAAEAAVKDSTTRIREEGIVRLVDEMACRIGGEYCAHTRRYVLRIPEFNAGAWPNGTIEVWTGLLLRCKTESELAAVMGHELVHFIRRHGLARMRNLRNQADMAMLFGAGMGMAGVPNSGQLANMVAMGNIASFSRENEAEADVKGVAMMADAGYDPYAAASIWRRLIKIREAGGEEEKFDYFLSTHPTNATRAEELGKLAEKIKRRPDAPNRLREVLLPIRFSMLTDEVNKGTFKRSMKLFDDLLEDDPAPGDILYHKGELHRRRGKDDDEIIALGFYHESCEARGAPPEAFRMVGLMRWRRGEKDMAREYFRRYLNARPDAGDREMIRKYLAGA